MKYILFVLIFSLISCNSVKRVMNDPEKFQIVADEVKRRGLCITDTIILRVDSIVYLTSDIIADTIQTKLIKECAIDTIINDISLKIDTSGNISISYLKNDKIKIIKEQRTIVDSSRIIVLKKDIKKLESSLDSCKREYASIQTKLSETKSEAKLFKWKAYSFFAGLVLIFLVAKRFRLV